MGCEQLIAGYLILCAVAGEEGALIAQGRQHSR